MKQFYFISAIVITLLSYFVLTGISHADTFCVSDANELQNALTTAASNIEDDTIKVEQGNYIGNFTYDSTQVHSLTIEGGYTSDCSSRNVDPTNTVLDGNGVGKILEFSASRTKGNLKVDGLTIQNGHRGISVNTGGASLFPTTS
ncbi:MAG: hypothetical protein AMJ42_03005 [Deltaproteobacteria bacterium DG_8]|nr:MAG: hypothetical protein AMJ42_03005 [Deltaproteobacteria bacterium DG_8]